MEVKKLGFGLSTLAALSVIPISLLTMPLVLSTASPVKAENVGTIKGPRLRVTPKLSYCSGSSGQGDWISWGHQTAAAACGSVNKKFESWGQRIRYRQYGRYYLNAINIVEVSCSQSQLFSVGGLGT